jgi:hypothetical protein
MAGASTVVFVELDELPACVAGRASIGRVVAGITVVVEVVGTAVDAAGRDVGGTVVSDRCPEGFVTTAWPAPEHPAQARAMTTPNPAMTDVPLLKCSR